MDPRFFRKYADLITEAQEGSSNSRSNQIWDYFEKAAMGNGSAQDIVGKTCQKFDITIDDLDSVGRENGVDDVYQYVNDAEDAYSDQPRPTYDALPHPSDQLDELSADTLGSYVKKANQDREQSYSSAKNRYDIGDSDAVVKANQHMQKRQDGMNTAYGKMNKLDELSADTLGSYANKAGKERDNEIDYANSRYDIGDHDSAQVGMQRAKKRQDGIDTASSKLNKKVAENSPGHDRSWHQGASDARDGVEPAKSRAKPVGRDEEDAYNSGYNSYRSLPAKSKKVAETRTRRK